MLRALIHGKLSSHLLAAEDVLTSSAFGALSYLPVTEGLQPFLAGVRGEAGEELQRRLDGVTAVSYAFWPLWTDGGGRLCEPDLLIGWESPAGRTMVVVEAKYRSGKSDLEIAGPEGDVPAAAGTSTDQLERQWSILEQKARDAGAVPFLVYLTAHVTEPSGDLDDTRVRLPRSSGEHANLLWLSWRSLPAALGVSSSPIARDLRQALIERYRLSYFNRLAIPRAAKPWRFLRAWKWPPAGIGVPFVFKRAGR